MRSRSQSQPTAVRRSLTAVLALLAIFATAIASPVANASSPKAADRKAGASISGQVLGGMDPVGYATVTVFNADTGRRLKSQVTDGDGYYNITGLPAGNIKVRARLDGYFDSWASGKNSWTGATIYRLSPGQHLTQTWDQQMILYLDVTREARITGTVLGGGVPLGRATVTVYDATTNAVLATTVADRAGRYDLGELRMGAVKVGASKRGWISSYANGKTTLAAADVIELFPGAVIDQSTDPTVLVLNLTRP